MEGETHIHIFQMIFVYDYFFLNNDVQIKKYLDLFM